MQDQDHALGKTCAGECAAIIHGIAYACPACDIYYCFTCAYYARWKCPKCGTQLT